jgi:hypothetical protein
MKKLQFAVLAGLVLATNASAALITYIGVAPAKSDFLAATGATDATGAGSLPNMGAVGTSLTLGNITFTTQPGHNIYVGTKGATLTALDGTTFNDWTTLLAGPDIAISDTENMDVTVNTGLSYSFGFDFVEPTTGSVNAATVVDSTFTVTLLDGATSVGSFTFNAPDNQAAFVGVWTDTLFNKVQIRETTGGIDNEFFGEFYKGVTPVPEPGTIVAGALMLLPFGATLIRRLRENQKG